MLSDLVLHTSLGSEDVAQMPTENGLRINVEDAEVIELTASEAVLREGIVSVESGDGGEEGKR